MVLTYQAILGSWRSHIDLKSVSTGQMVLVYIFSHLSVISTYNPIYRMYSPTCNQLQVRAIAKAVDLVFILSLPTVQHFCGVAKNPCHTRHCLSVKDGAFRMISADINQQEYRKAWKPGRTLLGCISNFPTSHGPSMCSHQFPGWVLFKWDMSLL